MSRNYLILAVYYLAAFSQGICLILFPAASFIWKAADGGSLSDAQYGILFLPQVCAAILVSAPLKKLTEIFGRRTIYYIALAANAAYLCGLLATHWTRGDASSTFVYLFAANFCLGAGFGLGISLMNFYVTSLLPEHRDAVMSGLHGSLGIGAALSPFLVNMFYRMGMWPMSMMTAGGVLVCAVLSSLIFSAAPNKVNDACTSGEARRTNSTLSALPMGIVCFLFTAILYGIIEAMIGNWTISYLSEEKRFSLRVASLSLSAFWIALTAGRIAATGLVRKVSVRNLYCISPVVVSASLIALVLLRTEQWAPAVMIAAGLGCSYFFPLSISLSTKYFDPWRETLSSMMMAAIMVGVGVGSFFTGYVRDRHGLAIGQSFQIGAVAAAGLAFVAARLTRPKKKTACDAE